MENIKSKSKKDLQALVAEKRDTLRRFRFHLSSGKAKNVKEGRDLRKEIARMMTEINK